MFRFKFFRCQGLFFARHVTLAVHFPTRAWVAEKADKRYPPKYSYSLHARETGR